MIGKEEAGTALSESPTSRPARHVGGRVHPPYTREEVEMTPLNVEARQSALAANTPPPPPPTKAGRSGGLPETAHCREIARALAGDDIAKLEEQP